MTTQRLWGTASQENIDQLILEYTSGEDHTLDEQLVKYDLRASEAHARMLQQQGYLKEADFSALQIALHALAKSHAAGDWKITLEEEDCHTAIENRLVSMTGEAGRSIHLGRSRNDQVLAALRLWLKDQADALASSAEAVAKALDVLTAKNGTIELPGYTHLQRAMPSTVALWAGGFSSEIRDDAEGLCAARRRADRNPLGSAAGYGVPLLNLNRNATAKELGFATVHEPVTAVQISRGKAEASVLFEASLLAQDLGRLAADLCLFATSEFGFVRLPNKFTTGSSIMPQKRNPDVFELARGRTGESFAALNEVMGIMTKMTSGYHRDLQLIKKPLFRGLSSVTQTAAVMAHAIPGVEFDASKTKSAMDPSLYAAEQAFCLVLEEGIPFREAYRRVKEKC
jgi:argininosuccinate lyase